MSCFAHFIAFLPRGSIELDLGVVSCQPAAELGSAEPAGQQELLELLERLREGERDIEP
jgi:hypothetical protein